MIRHKPKEADYKPIFGFPLANWHTWFAWYPVDTVDYGHVWLRRVWRRRCQSKLMLGPTVTWFQHVVGDTD